MGSLLSIAKVATKDTAHIFAIGRITRWDIEPKTPAAQTALQKFFEMLCSNGKAEAVTSNKPVQRQCGKYICSGGCLLKDGVNAYKEFFDFLKDYNTQNPNDPVTYHNFKWIMCCYLLWSARDETEFIPVKATYSRAVQLVDIPEIETTVSDDGNGGSYVYSVTDYDSAVKDKKPSIPKTADVTQLLSKYFPEDG
jgi:hypothetical protein